MTARRAAPKPIRLDVVVARPIWRLPELVPLTPRLRPGNESTRAIGFTVGEYSERGPDGDGDR